MRKCKHCRHEENFHRKPNGEPMPCDYQEPFESEIFCGCDNFEPEEVVNIGGAEITVLAEGERLPLDVPIVATRTKDVTFTIDGSKSGYPCSVCSEDCTLAPSSQQVIEHGNPVVCAVCITAMVEADEAAANNELN